MQDLPIDRLRELAGDFGCAPEGTLPDGCIEPVDAESWQRFLDMLTNSDWPVALDDQPSLGQLSVQVVVLGDESKTIKVWPGRRAIQINIFPGPTTRPTLFDFCLQEIVDQETADDLAHFVRRSGQAAGQVVSLSIEGDDTAVFATYDPVTDTFSVG